MSSFDSAIPYVLRNEGLLVDDPDDPGGITKYGITLPVLQAMGPFGDFDEDGDVDEQDLIQMDVTRAMTIFKSEHWTKFGYGRIEDQRVATKILDISVNFGPRQGHIIAQRAVWPGTGIELKQDGILGPKSIAAINHCPTMSMLVGLACESVLVYHRIVANKPKLSKFLLGWTRRAYRLPE